MADKTTVEVGTIGVKADKEIKSPSSLPKTITESWEKAVKGSSKLTTDAPKDKKATTLQLYGNVTLTMTDKGIQAKLSMVMAENKSMFGMANFESKMELDDPAEATESDVKQLVQALLKSAQDKVITQLEKKAKELEEEAKKKKGK